MTVSTAPAPLQLKSGCRQDSSQEEPLLVLGDLCGGGPLFPGSTRGYLLLVIAGEKDVLGFEAYRKLFADTNFLPAFSESIVNAVAAIFISLLIIVPTAYWVTLRLPRLRPVIEFITLTAVRDPGGCAGVRPHPSL